MRYPDEVIRPIAQKIHERNVALGLHRTPEEDWDDAELMLCLHGEEYEKPKWKPKEAK